jgi:hypothetical protein
VFTFEPSSEPRRRRNQFLAVRAAVWRYNKHALRLELVGTERRYGCCHYLATDQSLREEASPLLLSIPLTLLTEPVCEWLASIPLR